MTAIPEPAKASAVPTYQQPNPKAAVLGVIRAYSAIVDGVWISKTEGGKENELL